MYDWLLFIREKKQTIAPNGMNLIKKDFCDIAQVFYQEDLEKKFLIGYFNIKIKNLPRLDNSFLLNNRLKYF